MKIEGWCGPLETRTSEEKAEMLELKPVAVLGGGTG